MSHHITLTRQNGEIYINSRVTGIEFEGFNIDYSGYGNIKRLSVTLINTETGEKETVISRDTDTFQRKASKKVEKWLNQQKKENGKLLAELKTQEAELEREKARDLLKLVVQKNWDVKPEQFYKNEKFSLVKPAEPYLKVKKSLPKKPSKSSFNVKIGLFDAIFMSSKRAKLKRYKNSYRKALTKWEESRQQAIVENNVIEKENEEANKKWEAKVKEWEEKKDAFQKKQKQFNSQIEELFSRALKTSSNIERYFEIIFSSLDEILPDSYDNNYELEYRNETLLINYLLPNLDDLPTLEKVTYIISRNEHKEKHLSKTNIKKLYDKAIYSLVISLIHIAIEADKDNVISAVALNGIVKERNKKTGKKQTNTILSIQVEKDEFQNLDLLHVDPKECFKGLKGISSGNIIDKVPIKPIMKINKDDSRFIENQNIIDSVDDTNNLAAMDWQDFEHLIRDIFEKEFSKGGGEVNVTQSSRDQGVDAIAYDPDPIKGGKLVIQAKRYTNTVGVQYVRDLYGTVINEGANRGILITTSDYGSESHNFVKDKPISLINGQELLYLLKKHGYSAKIDLIEAKRIINDNKR